MFGASRKDNMIDCSVTQETDLTIYTVSGEASLGDVITVLKNVDQNELTKNCIWDFRGGTASCFSAEDVKTLARFSAQYCTRRNGGKTAVVVSSNLDFGLARMYQAHAENLAKDVAVGIFRDWQRCFAWVGGCGSGACDVANNVSRMPVV